MIKPKIKVIHKEFDQAEDEVSKWLESKNVLIEDIKVKITKGDEIVFVIIYNDDKDVGFEYL